MQKKLNLFILFGGTSLEHDVSILSAYYVLYFIDKALYNVHMLYLNKDNNLVFSKSLNDFENMKYEIFPKSNNAHIYKDKSLTFLKPHNLFKRKIKIDIILPIVHGKGVEDGIISSFINFYNLPCIIPNPLLSSIFQNKYYTKLLLTNLGVNTLDSQILDIDHISDYKYPLIFKPNNLGSSIGIKVIKSSDELLMHYHLHKHLDTSFIIEPYLTNIIEFSQAVYKAKNNLFTSLIEEVKHHNDIYTYQDKYEKDKNVIKILHDYMESDLFSLINNTTINIYNKLDINGMIRIDYLYNLNNNTIYVNEINTIPGSLSLPLFKEEKKVILNNLIEEALIAKQKETTTFVFKENTLKNKSLSIKK